MQICPIQAHPIQSITIIAAVAVVYVLEANPNYEYSHTKTL